MSSASAIYADANALFDEYMGMKHAYHVRCLELYGKYEAAKAEFEALPKPTNGAEKKERERAEKKLVGAAFVLTTMNLDTRVGCVG
jgi:hypothetical protein